MYLLSFRGGGEVREGSKKCFRFETEGITNHPCTPSISPSFESLLKKKKKSHHVFEDLALTVRYASRVPTNEG